MKKLTHIFNGLQVTETVGKKVFDDLKSYAHKAESLLQTRDICDANIARIKTEVIADALQGETSRLREHTTEIESNTKAKHDLNQKLAGAFGLLNQPLIEVAKESLAAAVACKKILKVIDDSWDSLPAEIQARVESEMSA